MGVAYLGSLQRFFVEYVSAGNNYGLGENQPGFGAESVLQLRGRILLSSLLYTFAAMDISVIPL